MLLIRGHLLQVEDICLTDLCQTDGMVYNMIWVFKNPSIIPLNPGCCFLDSQFLDYYKPQYVKGSIILELIINQQGLWTLLIC